MISRGANQSESDRPQRIANYLVVLFSFLCALGTVPCLSADTVQAQRTKFKQAWQLVNAGRQSAAQKLIDELQQYPLQAYLQAKQLEPTLQKAEHPSLEKFLAEHAGRYPAEKLRTKWLEWLAGAGRWRKFLEHYRPQTEPVLACAHKNALLQTNQTEGLFRQILPLWVVGKSQPKACNQIFKFFESHSAFDDPIVWQRFRAAIANNEAGLARYLTKKFSNKSAKTWATRWLDAHAKPDATLKRDYVLDDALLAKDVLFHALTRLARGNFSAAEKHWVRLNTSAKLSVADINRGHLILANAAGKAEHKNQLFYLDQVENQYADATLESLRMRRGIQLRAWDELYRWTNTAPKSATTNALRWRYWHARSAELLGHQDKARDTYQTLAGERDYYGFLAADKLQLVYQYNDKPITVTDAELKALLTKPGIAAAREFFEMGMLREANREWYWTIENFPKQALELAAYAASSWGWHNRAIATVGKARSYDDVRLRFPVLYRDDIARNSKKRGLEEALIFAIIRTESAFSASARSSAGALGLMQLMPATGRETGRRVGVQIKKSSQLLAPSTNIQIGTAYLSSLIKKYRRNFPMAAAAYNAGPHRVRQWRPQSSCLASDVWIDSIPFRETRRYVRTALFYYVIYQHRLGFEIKPLREMLLDIPATGSTQC